MRDIQCTLLFPVNVVYFLCNIYFSWQLLYFMIYVLLFDTTYQIIMMRWQYNLTYWENSNFRLWYLEPEIVVPRKSYGICARNLRYLAQKVTRIKFHASLEIYLWQGNLNLSTQWFLVIKPLQASVSFLYPLKTSETI